jgi:aldehyde dehydrogenase (NAD+)
LTTSIDAADGSVADWPMLIGGSWTPSQSAAWTEVRSPGRGDAPLARVPSGTPDDVDAAVAAASAALPAWRGLHFRERGRLLLKIADALEAAAEEFSRLTAQDTGNAVRTQARPETSTLVSLFRYFGGVAGEFKGTVLPAGDDQLQYTRREPLGVVGAILPWNSPLMIAGMKIPAALAAGNTLVVKPAEDAPLTILKLAQVINEFVPAGAFNVVTGRGSVVGEAIVRHPGINKVSFTGSSEVGQGVGSTAGGRLAHVSLELGGKSPNIVCPSAATPEVIEETAEGVLLAMRFTRQGQSCTAGSRLFLHEDIHDEFLEVLARKAAALKVGDPLDESTDMGAIINRKQFESVLGYIQDGMSQPDVKVVLDGSRFVDDGLDGYYQAPTILAGVKNDWRVAAEEIFGPVLVAIRWSTVDEVVEMANDSHYGLAAYVWSRNLDEAVGIAHRVESGWVQVNQGGGQVVGQSYGGYKASGIGREFSIEGALESFTQTKQINVKLSLSTGAAVAG